jgi:hypothetical protein
MTAVVKRIPNDRQTGRRGPRPLVGRFVPVLPFAALREIFIGLKFRTPYASSDRQS